MSRGASVQIVKTDGSVLDWKVTDEQADALIKTLFKSTPSRPYSRDNQANWKRRGPKPAVPIEGELLDRALDLRESGLTKEAIARELQVPARTLGRAFDRYDDAQA